MGSITISCPTNKLLNNRAHGNVCGQIYCYLNLSSHQGTMNYCIVPFFKQDCKDHDEETSLYFVLALFHIAKGDKLVAIDDFPISEGTSVDQVRNQLRGEPGTLVSISFEREGVSGVQTITMPRQVVRMRDVKLATLVGNPADGIGYVQLTGFASDAGREVRQAIMALQRAAEDASGGERSLQGLVLDLRGNPGGLLTSAVDVASLLVPRGSDIVSAKGRGFPGILYRSRVEPLLEANTKLAVLINGNTASAAEIVSGAVQDLDVGVIVGSDRTFGKGLVQNVEELPFNSALKFTVAKYYTPSGRCIQGK